jgi:hypothetical protein
MHNRSFSSILSDPATTQFTLPPDFFRLQGQLAIYAPGLPTVSGSEDEPTLLQGLFAQNCEYGRRLLECFGELKKRIVGEGEREREGEGVVRGSNQGRMRKRDEEGRQRGRVEMLAALKNLKSGVRKVFAKIFD